MRRRRHPLLVLATLALGASAGCSDPVTTIVLVRHAEKDKGEDPSLVAPGHERAKALIGVVAEAGISAIYTTQLARTQQTAEPLAKALGLDPGVIPVKRGAVPGHVQAVADRIRSHHAGEGVLVVGHSNTLPLIMAALGVPSPPTIADHEYDDLFVVLAKKGPPAQLIRARYGPPNPSPR